MIVSKCGLSSLAGADADDVVDGENEDLPVADAAGARDRLDQLARPPRAFVFEQQLDLDLRQEVDDVLGAAIELGVALLSAEPLDLRHGHALYALLGEGLLHLVELEGFDDRLDFLHGRILSWSFTLSAACGATAVPRFAGVASLPKGGECVA